MPLEIDAVPHITCVTILLLSRKETRAFERDIGFRAAIRGMALNQLEAEPSAWECIIYSDEGREMDRRHRGEIPGAVEAVEAAIERELTVLALAQHPALTRCEQFAVLLNG